MRPNASSFFRPSSLNTHGLWRGGREAIRRTIPPGIEEWDGAHSVSWFSTKKAQGYKLRLRTNGLRLSSLPSFSCSNISSPTLPPSCPTSSILRPPSCPTSLIPPPSVMPDIVNPPALRHARCCQSPLRHARCCQSPPPSCPTLSIPPSVIPDIFNRESKAFPKQGRPLPPPSCLMLSIPLCHSRHL